MLHPASYRVLVHGGICLGGVVEPWRSVATFTAVVAVAVVHCAVMVIESWMEDNTNISKMSE